MINSKSLKIRSLYQKNGKKGKSEKFKPLIINDSHFILTPFL